MCVLQTGSPTHAPTFANAHTPTSAPTVPVSTGQELVRSHCAREKGHAHATCACVHGDHGNTSDPYSCQEAHHGHTDLLVMFFPFFSLLVGCIVRQICVRFPAFPLPYTVALLLLGIIVGEVISEMHSHDDFAHSAEIMAGIDPHLMLFIFLPPLLFESAFNIKWHVFKKTAGAAILLATFGVIARLLLFILCLLFFA